MPPFLIPLLGQGLDLIANFALTKGKQALEEATGVKLPEDGKLDNEQVMKLKEYQMIHEEKLMAMTLENSKLDLEQYKLEVEDRGSARDREVSVNTSANSTWLAKNATSLLATAVVALSFVLFYMVIYTTIPADKKDIVIYILGVLSGAVTQVLSYYFGSSKGSSNKDDALASAVRGMK